MKIQNDLNTISRGTYEIIGLEQLKKKMERSHREKKPLIVKAGFDPTAPDIHLGHFVLLRKMKQFQDLGHQVVFLIGDFTAQVGDPTGRHELRKKMSFEEIEKNALTYQQQVFKVLDSKKTSIVFNSHWLGKMTPQDLMELTAHSTVAQMLARADFKKRFEEGREISILEFLYPLLQGYDSVHLQADIELGGSDQKFNLLMGRQIQEAMGQEPQVVLMTPLLEGLDGVQKMSKSLGNYIGIHEPAKEIFGKVMSISDDLMMKYFEVLTQENLNDIQDMHPKDAKMKLAGILVEMFHGKEAQEVAHEQFEKVFSQKDIPDDILEISIKEGSPELLSVLQSTGLVATKNEARRLLKQSAITFEGHVISDEHWPIQKGILKIGKRRFLKLT